jgi:hypothetical protein
MRDAARNKQASFRLSTFAFRLLIFLASSAYLNPEAWQ